MSGTISVDLLVRLQRVQDLFSYLEGVFLGLYSPEGEELTLPSRLPAACAAALAKRSCFPRAGEGYEHYCSEGRWCRWIPVSEHPPEEMRGNRPAARALVLCGSTKARPPEVMSLVEAVYALAFAGHGAPAAARAAPGAAELPPKSREAPSASWGLTGREVEILGLLAQGLGNREIAQRLYLSESTVKTHVANIFRKCGLENRAQAATFALREGYTSGGAASSTHIRDPRGAGRK